MNATAQVSAAPVTGPKLDNRRVFAAVVDLLIVAAGAAVVLLAGDSLTGERQGALAAVILGWALYYFFALESGDGQTVGKKLMKLRVVQANGAPAGMREVAVRTVLRVVDNYLVGLIVMLATGERRQRIGDLAAGTIVVDASTPAVTAASAAPAAPAVPVAAPGEEVAEVAEVAEAPAEEPPAVPDPTRTITLPSRPARPATLDDLTEPAAEEQAVAEEPVAETEPVAEEPAFDFEPVEERPDFHVERVVEDEPVVEEEPAAEVDEDPVPEILSPSLEELAQDVAAATVEDEPAEEQPAEEQPADESPEDDEPMTVKSVETVSAIDLVMGGAPEADPESTPESASDPEDPASV